MFKKLLSLLLIVSMLGQAQAFCGFYVAQADAKLFNKSSQVIIVRKDGQTVITMSSDFEGKVEDFAMVVPVPVVIKKEQIRLARPDIFQKLDAYSGPRLVEYHDENPCYPQPRYEMEMSAAPARSTSIEVEDDEMLDSALGVTIEEQYSIGEYDILVLSAKESDGLEKWLKINEYKIPAGAAEVLEPYIKSQMKFFVVKVNLNEVDQKTGETLRPIQMSFRSDKFGLPIRLGMANARGDQDMIVYAFSDQGRIETTNYRTVKVPSNRDIPTFVRDEFGDFYTSVFDRAWKREGKKAVFLEYSWDISSSNYVKCDPCASTPPAYADLREAGVFWATNQAPQGWGGSDYQGDVFITRLHVRYNRYSFPQDLQFQVTPNKEQFQGRYVMRNPAQGDLKCEEAQNYLVSLVDRREKELEELAALTGWDIAQHEDYVEKYRGMISKDRQPWLGPMDKDERNYVAPVGGHDTPQGPWGMIPWLATAVAGLGLLGLWMRRRWAV
ncbi:MAG: DUF2330 domain-containing protein [Bacteroidota bacterium]